MEFGKLKIHPQILWIVAFIIIVILQAAPKIIQAWQGCN